MIKEEGYLQTGEIEDESYIHDEEEVIENNIEFQRRKPNSVIGILGREGGLIR